jgi:hypothetical protein
MNRTCWQAPGAASYRAARALARRLAGLPKGLRRIAPIKVLN